MKKLKLVLIAPLLAFLLGGAITGSTQALDPLPRGYLDNAGSRGGDSIDSGTLEAVSRQKVEFTSPGVMTANAGGGAALRYPYAGHIAQVLGVSGDYYQIQFGRKVGWVPKDTVRLTEKDEDYIRLAWQFIEPNKSSYIEKSPDLSGYNVYAPVMYGVGSSSIYIFSGQNFANNITLARANGYKVWLTVQQFGTNPNFKDEIIQQIIDAAILHDVDGINIDFEGMGRDNQAGFTEFMTKLYPKAQAQGFVVSLDVTRHAANLYGLSYDREALAQVSDYIALMAYDEHWRTSPIAGSVASMPWTDSSIRALLREVPAEKILLGIPFYTRNWSYNSTVATEDKVILKEDIILRTEPSSVSGTAKVLHLGKAGETFPYLGSVLGEAIMGDSLWYVLDVNGQTAYAPGHSRYTAYVTAGEAYGDSGLSSYALPLQAGLDIYANLDMEAGTSKFYTRNGTRVQMDNVVITYDEAAGQNMVAYADDQGKLNKIWIEEFNSLRQRRLLMEHYNLAGLAAWSLEWVDSDLGVWNMISE